MRTLNWVLVVVGMAMIAGCSKHVPASQTASAAAAGETTKVSRSGGVFSVRDETKNRLLLRDIGLSCQAADVSRMPQTVDELKALLKDSPQCLKAVESGDFALAPKPQASGNSLFIYERDADAKGDRLVLMGDGRVEKKSAAEFVELKKE